MIWTKKSRLGEKDKIEDILLIRFIKTTSKHEVEHEQGPCAGKEEKMKENQRFISTISVIKKKTKR